MLHARIFSDSVRFVDISHFRVEGMRVTVTPGWEYQPCDVVVMYGLANPPRRSKQGLLRNALYREHKGPIVVIESSLIGRSFKQRLPGWLSALRRRPLRPRQAHPYYRVAVGGALGDDADFGAQNSPPDRWERMQAEFGIQLRPYRTDGSHIVVIGQVPLDASLRGVDVSEWLQETVRAIREISGRPILVRLHPSTRWRYAEKVKNAFAGRPDITVTAGERPLAEDLSGAWTCATLSSGAAVDALIEGIPPICLSPASLAYKICSRDLADIERPKQPDREQFMRDLAYSQWSLAEMADGTAWRHIRPAVERELGRVAGGKLAHADSNQLLPRPSLVARLLDRLGPDQSLDAKGSDRRWESSLARWNAVASVLPENARTLIGQGKALFRLRRFEEATAVFSRLRLLRPDLAFAHEGAARSAEKAGNWPAAEAAWGAAARLAPDRLVPLRGRAKALLRLQRDDEAERDFTHLCRTHPSDAAGFRGLAQIAMRRREWEQALELFDLMWRRFRDAEALRQQISLLIRLRRLDDAERVVDTLKSPGSPMLPYLLAAARLLEHRHDWATIHELLASHDKLVSANWLLTFSHASALGKLGRAEDAAAVLERSQAGTPSSRLNLKARILIETRRYEEAAESLRRIWEGPDVGVIPPELMAPLVDAAWETGGPTQAHAVLDRLIREAPRDKSGEILRLQAPFREARLKFLAGLLASPPRLAKADAGIECRIEQQLSAMPQAAPELGPVREISRLYAQLRAGHAAFFPNPSNSLSDALEVASGIVHAADEKRPFSLIRLGDGEGNLLPYRPEFETFHLSDSLETQFTWWGEDAPAPGEAETLQTLLLQALRSADIVGIPDLDRVCRTMLNYPLHTAHDGSRNADGGRNARGLLASIDATIGVNGGAAMVTSCHVHQALSFWGLWDVLLPRLGRLSAITCHPDLSRVLAEEHGVDIERVHLVPPERKYARAFGGTRDGRHYPDVFEELRVELSEVRSGDVYLVAAGMLGKIYCTWIKQAGGVAIDIGSAADFWCGYQTRGLADNAAYRSPRGVQEQVRQLIASHPRYQVLLGLRVWEDAVATGS